MQSYKAVELQHLELNIAVANFQLALLVCLATSRHYYTTFYLVYHWKTRGNLDVIEINKNDSVICVNDRQLESVPFYK